MAYIRGIIYQVGTSYNVRTWFCFMGMCLSIDQGAKTPTPHPASQPTRGLKLRLPLTKFFTPYPFDITANPCSYPMFKII